MTHDELLARMNLYTVCDRPTKPGMVCDNKHLRESYPEWFALRAVMELHKPWDVETEGGTFTLCNACSRRADLPGYGILYPCKTIQAIEKELS